MNRSLRASRLARVPFSVGVGLLLLALPLTSMRAEHEDEKQRGTIVGRVIDVESHEPLGWTAILLVELNRSAVAHEDGRFWFRGIPPGRYTLKSLRLGYQTTVTPVVVRSADTVTVTVAMLSTPLQTETVVVVGEAGAGRSVVKAEEVFSGRRLQRQLGRTLAETVNNEPGISQRTMGPAPARPVIRGLGGDRLLILEDGSRTGDLSATASDHAVVIDPMTAERIEIIRGPAALVYGSNTLGGVINVARGQIPSYRTDHWHGSGGLQAESVNESFTGGGSVWFPAGPLTVRLDGNARSARDIRTPAGLLRNTSIRTYNSAGGVSYIDEWGYAGVAGSYYDSRYGVPGGFVGAHPHGIRVELERSHVEGRVEVINSLPLSKRLELNAGYLQYYHRELESSGSVGTEFGVLTYHASALAYLEPFSIFGNGIAGVWGEYRDFSAGGFIFTPPTVEKTVAGFLYQETALGELTLQGAIRIDAKNVEPSQPRESQRIGSIRRRTFSNVSASLMGIYEAVPSIFLGASLMRSFRAPGIEELFSEGPHLAAYSFEIGNPNLGEEVGFGLEAFLRYSGSRGRAQFAVFRNRIGGYIFPRNTGLINYRTLLPIYQYDGRGALMVGSELSFDWRLTTEVAASGSVSYVRGELIDTHTPLPMMPPVNGKVGLRYSRGPLVLGGTIRGAARQNRVDEFEEPTAGYVVPDVFVQYQLTTGPFLHTVVLTLENITNSEYRIHLSRVKSILPEPARNFKLLYRTYF